MNRRFRLNINTENDAFFDQDTRAYDPAPELARILRRIATALEQDPRGPWHAAGAAHGGLNQTIRDINGNDVGRYLVTTEAQS